MYRLLLQCILSGHGNDNAMVLAGDYVDEDEDDVLTAQNSVGECVYGIGQIASSIHEIKVELTKMNTQKITMTLDCDRTVHRGQESVLVRMK